MIITNKEELLRPCEDVSSLEEGIEIERKLVLELNNEKLGVGLAAPQIGIFKNVFVAWLRQNNEICSFMNPKIVSLSEPFIFEGEGCLSFPGQYIDTIRYKSVKIQDLQCPEGEVWHSEARQDFPIIIQHEMDHLEMKTMFDHQVPDKYDPCFCGSGNKFKFCCLNKL